MNKKNRMEIKIDELLATSILILHFFSKLLLLRCFIKSLHPI